MKRGKRTFLFFHFFCEEYPFDFLGLDVPFFSELKYRYALLSMRLLLVPPIFIWFCFFCYCFTNWWYAFNTDWSFENLKKKMHIYIDINIYKSRIFHILWCVLLIVVIVYMYIPYTWVLLFFLAFFCSRKAQNDKQRVDIWNEEQNWTLSKLVLLIHATRKAKRKKEKKRTPSPILLTNYCS